MKADEGKCLLIIRNNEYVSFKSGVTETENSNCEKLLGVNVDSKLGFKEHPDVSRKVIASSQCCTVHECC